MCSPSRSVIASVMSAECLCEFCCVLGYLCRSKSVDVLFGYVQQQDTNEFTYLSKPEVGSAVNTSSSVTQKAYLMCQLCHFRETVSQSYLSPKSRTGSAPRTSCFSIDRSSYRSDSPNPVFKLLVSGSVKTTIVHELPSPRF